MQKNFTLSLFTLMLPVLILSGCNRSQGLEVKNVKLVSFQITGLASVEQGKELKTTLKNIKGITGAAVNFSSKLIAISYHPDEIDDRKIRNLIAETPGLEVKSYVLKADPNKPGCPVKGVRNWLSLN